MNLPAQGWELFYADGTVRSSKEYAWADLSVDNVLVLTIWHDYHVPGCRQKTMCVGKDYYYYEGENDWGDSDNFDDVKNKSYKRGVWVTNEEFEQVYRTAFEKLDF